MSNETPKLTHKQQVFINEYLKSFNATASAIAAGYSEKTAYSIGWENLRKPEIQAEITRRLEEVHMSADEALKLLSDIARGDIGEAVNEFGAVDLAELHRQGKTRLIKKVKQRTITKLGKKEEDEDVEIHDTELELYPADSALRDVLKIHGRYKENVDLTSGGEKINQSISDETVNRAISTLTEALGEIISGKSDKPAGEVVSTK